MGDYTEKARDHFFHPRNAGRVEPADGTVKDAEEYERLKRSGRFRDVFFLLEGPNLKEGVG